MFWLVLSLYVFVVCNSFLFNKESQSVLVLGSGGLIGSELVRSLKKVGYNVVEVAGRDHVDLRNEAAFKTWIATFDQDKPIAFAYFLACEVGGSKFLYGKAQVDIITSNILMYQVLFPWFKEHNIPFIFTSTSLQSENSPYGSVKRIGEQWINSMGIGKSVRLWNVFGEEKIGIKSRVISDWIVACLENGQIKSLTDGNEQRQFMFTRDCAAGLVKMMEIYEELDSVTDLSSFEWITMRDLSQKITTLSPVQCDAIFSEDSSRVPQPDSPSSNSALYSSGWKLEWDLDTAISHLFNVYGKSCPFSESERKDSQCTD